MVSFQLAQSSILCVNTGLATDPKQERNILNDLWLQMEITVSKKGVKNNCSSLLLQYFSVQCQIIVKVFSDKY